jgi:TonB family protein
MNGRLVKASSNCGALSAPPPFTRQLYCSRNMKVMRATVAAALAVILCLAGIIQLNASEELTRAKELYRAASYDEALIVLDSVRPSDDEAVEVHQFRVLCLVALDRKEDAKRAIAALITAAPSYQLSDEDASPRVRTLFAEVRRSVMPSIVQRAYAEAKAAYERKDPTATAQFDRVLTMLKDPDVAKDPSLADLATVVSGFRDLSVAAAAPAPALVTTPAAPPAGAAATVRRPTASGAAAAIVAPVAISQVLPPMPLRDPRQWDGEVEVTVNAAGKVTAARMTKSIHPTYDSAVLRAARSWTYKPATRDGVPTQMMKLVNIHIDTRPACSPRVNTNCRPASE